MKLYTDFNRFADLPDLNKSFKEDSCIFKALSAFSQLSDHFQVLCDPVETINPIYGDILTD